MTAEVSTDPRTFGLAVAAPVVELIDIKKSFGGNVVLEGVTLAARPGFTGLIGPNGAGKTTCLNVISGYLRPDEGQVRVAGQNVIGLPSHRIADRGVSRTFQTPRLIPNMSALENVMAGGNRHFRHGHLAELFGHPGARRDEKALREKALGLLEVFGLGDQPERRADAFPIGSQKIIEVGRALLNEPVVLLLDEPGAGLGAQDIDRLMQGLSGWLEGRDCAVVIIEHDLELITRLCPTAAVLHFGRIIQSGAPKDVLRDPIVIEAYLGADYAAGD